MLGLLVPSLVEFELKFHRSEFTLQLLVLLLESEALGILEHHLASSILVFESELGLISGNRSEGIDFVADVLCVIRLVRCWLHLADEALGSICMFGG